MSGKKLKLKSSAILDEADEGAVLVDGMTGAICALNASGHLLVSRLVKGAHLPELTASLARGYGLSKEVAAADVSTFLDELDSFGFLHASTSEISDNRS